MNCPDCKHPIELHSDFFCVHTGCSCNQGMATAKAKAERDLYKAQLEAAQEQTIEMWTINENVKLHKQLDVAKSQLENIELALDIDDAHRYAKDALAKIDEIGVENAGI
jgi:outer membrane PBP1 activator LpoA protein